MPDHTVHSDGECRVEAFARHILVPIDFSESSHAALAMTLSIVERCEASLHLLHVIERVVGPEPIEWNLGVRREIDRAIERNALEDLRRLLSADDRARLQVRVVVHWGTPAIEILRYVNAHHVDLIAMGKDGRGGIKHFLLGSVANAVVRNAPCAVLSVRSSAARPLVHHAHGRQLAHHVFGH